MPQRMREDVRPTVPDDAHADGERAQIEGCGVERAGEGVVSRIDHLEAAVEQESVDAVRALPAADLVRGRTPAR